MIDTAKAQRDGLVVLTSAGVDALKITAQSPLKFTKETRPTRMAALQQWARGLERQLPAGCDVDHNSLSVSGQIVEIAVPLSSIAITEAVLAQQGIRVDLIRPMQVAGPATQATSPTASLNRMTLDELLNHEATHPDKCAVVFCQLAACVTGHSAIGIGVDPANINNGIIIVNYSGQPASLPLPTSVSLEGKDVAVSWASGLGMNVPHARAATNAGNKAQP